MSATPSPLSPLVRLVLFICCLAIAASIFAAAHYVVVDLPAQKNIQAPENARYSNLNCDLCRKNCKIDPDYFSCLVICQDLECSGAV